MKRGECILLAALVILIAGLLIAAPRITKALDAPAAQTDMVLIPGGVFTMGGAAGDTSCLPSEHPTHNVKLDSFYLDVHEVMVAEYAQCVKAGVCQEPRSKPDQPAEFYNWKKADRENHPVNGVAWNDANTYCQWRQKRLPTEAEFEYVLRGGGQNNIFPWGNETTPPTGYGNYADESTRTRFPELSIFVGYNDAHVGTAPVCSFARNAYGLCDVSGNVWEWVADWYNEASYQADQPNNPHGAASGTSRGLRGGGWNSGPGSVRSSYRAALPPDDFGDGLGFRCAAEQASPPPPPTPTPAPPTPTPLPAPPPAPLPHEIDGMVLLPGGTFMMGCVEGDNQCNDDEKPAHRVSLDSFYMDEHEVTVAEYALCVNAGVCISAQFVDNPSYDTFFSNDVRHRNHPVIGINWNSADAYCRWRGKRLPTEAEFEYALRGGQEGYIYPWGTNGTPPTRYGNYSDEAILRLFPSWRQFVNSWFHGYNDGFMGMSPVCSFTRNPFGLCDISGNVWEWTADWYDDNYYQSSPANNPRGPSSGKSRVIRGGSWMTSPRFVRTSYRDNKSPVYWVWDLGFRCSRDAQQTAPPSAPTPPPAPTPAPAVQLTPTPESAVRGRVFARILNVDDEARILVNGQVAVHGYWGRGEHGAQIGHHPGFTEWVEITALCRRGANAFRFWVWNAAIPGTSSATFEVRVNNKIVLRKVFFVNDSSQGVKFDRTFDLHLD